MAQQLIAINGNEEFPYLLQPSDISEAMGLPAGIAPGGFNVAGAIDTTIDNSSGVVNLEDSAWNNTVKLDSNITYIALPSSSPTNAVIQFYPMAEPSGNPNATWTLNVGNGSNQYINFEAGGIANQTYVEVPYNCSLTILSRGNGEMNIIGGTYLLTNNIGNNNFLGGIGVNPAVLNRTGLNAINILPNSSWEYGINSYWTYSPSISDLLDVNNPSGYNALYVAASTSSDGDTFTIASEPIYFPAGVGTSLILSANIYNNGVSSSGVFEEYPLYAYLNFYDYNMNLLGNELAFTVPAGHGWGLVSGTVVIPSSMSGFGYIGVSFSGTVFGEQGGNAITQVKLEEDNVPGRIGHSLPSLYSDEASNAIFASNSFSGSGYQKLPSGMIMQWGKATNNGQSGSTPGTATFPIAFPNACFQVLMTDNGASAIRYWTGDYTTTGFSLGAIETDSGGTPIYLVSGGAVGSFIAFGW